MNRGAPFLIGAAACAVAACASGTGAVQVRPLVGTAAASIDKDERLAEATGQLALGNTGLALELYRKHLRFEPASVAAQLGIAACYDRMGRYDVSRLHYEAALALSPANPDLLERFAVSLERQGQTAEAASVRDEIRMRAEIVTATAIARPTVDQGQLDIAASDIPMMAASITVSLPPAEPVVTASVVAAEIESAPVADTNLRVAVSAELPVPVLAAQSEVPRTLPSPSEEVPTPVRVARSEAPRALLSPTVEIPAPVGVARSGAPATLLSPREEVPPPVRVARSEAPAALLSPSEEVPAPVRTARSEARLVRLSPSEVALVSAGRSLWRPQVIAQTASSTTVRFVPLKSAGGRAPNVRLLNAARTAGLAARTRGYLFDRGWRKIAIGDAAQVRERSLILYPASRRKTAASLAAQFGIPITRETQGNEIVMLLGRDASGLKILRESA